MNDLCLTDLTASVQYNCNVSDARHGADYALCTYLMKMREYFRWERGLPYGAALARDEVGDWLQEREQLWEDLAEADLRPLAIEGREFDPFDADAINDVLMPLGLVYSAGLGNSGKPHFFLGRLESVREAGDFRIAVAAGEYARDLTAPPAMHLGDRIYLRRESLRRMLWEKLESWRWSRPDNALGRAFAYYEFERDLASALEAMASVEIDTLLLHEVGEHRAGDLLGGDWGEMLLDLLFTPAEVMVRAVRDHLADCLSTLPALLGQENPAPLHFYFGGLSAMRKELFPTLDQAYCRWVESGRREPLMAVVDAGHKHWLDLGRQALDLYRAEPRGAAERVAGLVRAHPL